MKIYILVSLLVGLFLGSLVTYQVTQTNISKNSENIDGKVFSLEAEHQEESKTDTLISHAPKIESVSADSLAKPSDDTHGLKPLGLGIQKSPDILVCLDHLKPSDITEWQTKWRKRVDDFIATNDSFWNSKGNHSFDPSIIPSIQGTYKGPWKFANNVELKAELVVEIHSEINGIIKLEASREGSSSDQNVSFNCSRDIMTKKDLGFDDKENAINVFMYNCNPEILGSIYSQFAFKIPIGMQKGQQKRVEAFGLTENFDWKSVGFLDLVKQ